MSTAARAAIVSSSKYKYALFSLAALMVAYVFSHNERFLINAADPEWQHIASFKWWLLPHGIAGACTILLGPMQFSDRLRQRYTKLHRVVGRFYVFGALIAAPLGVYIQFFEERIGGPRSFTMAATIDAILLTSTTAIAFMFILQGKTNLHRQWMTRSFCVAFVFVEVRVIGGITGWDADPAAIETIVWCCVGMSLLVGDIILQIQESLRTRRPVKAQPAAAGA